MAEFIAVNDNLEICKKKKKINVGIVLWALLMPQLKNGIKLSLIV